MVETGYQRWPPMILLPVFTPSCSQPPPLLHQGLVLITNRIWQKWWYGAPPNSFIKNSTTSVLCSLSSSLSPCLSFSLSPPANNHVSELRSGSSGDFPCGLVIKTLPSNAEDEGSNSSRGAKMPHAPGPENQNIKQKQYCIKFNKNFKNWSTWKNKQKQKWIFHPCQAFGWGHLH